MSEMPGLEQGNITFKGREFTVERLTVDNARREVQHEVMSNVVEPVAEQIIIDSPEARHETPEVTQILAVGKLFHELREAASGDEGSERELLSRFELAA